MGKTLIYHSSPSIATQLQYNFEFADRTEKPVSLPQKSKNIAPNSLFSVEFEK